MPTPGLNEQLERIKTILEELDFGEIVPGAPPRSPGDAGFVAPKYVVFTESPESFDRDENIDVLRSPLDTYDATIEGVPVVLGRVNAWILDEMNLRQDITVARDARGFEVPGAGGRVIITRTFSLFFYYQYGGGGVAHVRDVIERARRRFNELPKLGFTADFAEFMDGRNGGLQVPLETEGDFKGVIAYVRGCQLTTRAIEPL